MDNDIIATIKQSIDCFSVAEQLNIQINNYRSKSFIHEGNNNSSVMYDKDGQRWFSFSDGVGGDCIDMYAYVNNISVSSAISQLAAQLGIKYGDEKYQHRIDTIKNYVKSCHDNLRNTDYDYLRSRKITDETIKKYNIGYDPKTKRIIIPIYKNGNAVAWCGRGNEGAKYKKTPNSYADTFFRESDTLYGYDTLNRGNDTLIITEGVFDFLSLEQEGYSVLANATGLSHKNAENVCFIAKKFKRVILCFDGDSAGNGFAKRLMPKLFENNIQFDVFNDFPDNCKDVSDMYTNDYNLSMLITNAVNGVQMYLKSNLNDYDSLFAYVHKNAPYISRSFKKTILEHFETFPATADEKKAFKKEINRPKTDMELLDECLKHFNKTLMRAGDYNYYHWNGKFWEKILEEKVKTMIRRFLSDYNGTVTNRVITAFKDEITTDLIPNSKDCLNLNNGTLYLNGFIGDYYEFKHTHNPDDFCTYILSYDYNENAQSDVWDGFMDKITCYDRTIQQRFSEYVGSVFMPFTVEQKGFLFYGDGSNGKSLFVETIRNLFGGNALCSNIDLDHLGGRFDRSELIGMWVNFCNEADSKGSSEKAVKSILSNSTIDTDVKGKEHITFKPRCKIFVDCNSMPKADEQKGWSRRWEGTVHTFKAKFTRDASIVDNKTVFEIDPAIEDDLKQPETLSAMLNWALSGYKMLINDNYKYCVCTEDKEAESEFIKASNHLGYFVDSLPEGYFRYGQTFDTMFNMYNEWCETGKYLLNDRYNRDQFKRHLKSALATIDVCPKNKKINGETTVMYVYKDV